MISKIRTLSDTFRPGRREGGGPFDVCFYSFSEIDEIWIRSTALATARMGMRPVVLTASTKEAGWEGIYLNTGVKHQMGVAPSEIVDWPTDVLVTATSAVDRVILPTAAKHLVHMPHSLASLHAIYPQGSFDGYDILFACGPHHVQEFSLLKEACGSADWRAVEVGYGKLDLLLDRLRSSDEHPATSQKHVLIAPSWGEDNLVEKLGEPLIEELLNSGYHVTLRPHYQLFEDSVPLLETIQTRFGSNDSFCLEDPSVRDGSIFVADCMISDYSGAAYEFAALRQRRAVFVDVAQKVVNPSWRSINVPPMEVWARPVVGSVADASVDSVITQVASSIENDAVSPLQPTDMSSFLFSVGLGGCGERAALEIERLIGEARS